MKQAGFKRLPVSTRSMTQRSTLPSLFSKTLRLPGPAEFEMLLEQLSAAMILVDGRSDTIIMANKGAVELTGFIRDELIGRKGDLLFANDDGPVRVRELWQASHETASETRVLMSLSRHTGPAVDVEANLSGLGINGSWMLVELETVQSVLTRQAEARHHDELWKVMETLVSIPQEKNLESALMRVLQAGQELTGAALTAIYRANGNKPSLSQTLGCGPVETLPVEIGSDDLMHLQVPALWHRRRRAVAELQKAARAGGMSFLASVPLGQPKAVIGLLISCGMDEPGSDILKSMQVLAQSITTIIQQHSFYNNLQNSLDQRAFMLALSEVVLEGIHDGIVIISPNLMILDMNHAAEEGLGYTTQEVAGQVIDKILVSNHSLDSLLASVQKGDRLASLEGIQLYRRSGKDFRANLLAIPIRTSEGLAGIALIFQDLSEQEKYRARNEILEQRALLGEITASFAHEVRNPINNINLGLQTLANKLAPEDPNHAKVQLLQQDCDRLAALIKSGLSFVKPMEYTMEPIDLGPWLRQFMERWRGRFARENILEQVKVEPGKHRIEGDPRALDQVFSNLFQNAVQAMSESSSHKGGLLTLIVRRVLEEDGPAQIEVTIADTGPGIPEDIRNRIFEPFFTTRQGGTGVGLAVVKRIVTAHRGVVSVNSIPGATAFRLRFPMLKP